MAFGLRVVHDITCLMCSHQKISFLPAPPFTLWEILYMSFLPGLQFVCNLTGLCALMIFHHWLQLQNCSYCETIYVRESINIWLWFYVLVYQVKWKEEMEKGRGERRREREGDRETKKREIPICWIIHKVPATALGNRLKPGAQNSRTQWLNDSHCLLECALEGSWNQVLQVEHWTYSLQYGKGAS